MPSQQAQSRLQLHAAIQRSNLTASEARLWAAINRRQLGVQFRRQVVVGKFIANFAAPQARLIVEVDGLYHRQRRSADTRRDAKLARLGYRVLRLEAKVVMEQLPIAVQLIRQALELADRNPPGGPRNPPGGACMRIVTEQPARAAGGSLRDRG